MARSPRLGAPTETEHRTTPSPAARPPAPPNPDAAALQKLDDELASLSAQLSGLWKGARPQALVDRLAQLREERNTLATRMTGASGAAKASAAPAPPSVSRSTTPTTSAASTRIDLEAAERLVRAGVATLSSETRCAILEGLLHNPAIGGSILNPAILQSGRTRAQQVVAALLTDDPPGNHLLALLAEKGLAFELARQLGSEVVTKSPALSARVAAAVMRQLGITEGLVDRGLLNEIAPVRSPDVAQLESVVHTPALLQHFGSLERFDLLRAILATSAQAVGGKADASRGALASALTKNLPEWAKQDLSVMLIKHLPTVPEWREALGGVQAAAPLERTIEAYAARDLRVRDFGLMRLGMRALTKYGGTAADYDLPKVAQGPQRLLAAEAAIRATRYVRDLDPTYEGISYMPGVVRGENIGTMTIKLHRRGGEITDLGKIDMNDVDSYSVHGVMAQMAQLVNDHHYRGTSVANAPRKPLPLVNHVREKIDPSAWTFPPRKARSAGVEFVGFSETATLPLSEMKKLLEHGGLLKPGEALPQEPGALEAHLKGLVSKREAGEPGVPNGISPLKLLPGDRVEMDVRVAEVLAKAAWVNKVAPEKLFAMVPATDQRFPHLRPGSGYSFLRLVDGQPRFVMPAEAYLLYVGGDLLPMAHDEELGKGTPTAEAIRAHLEKTLRETYEVIPDVRLLPSGEIAIPDEHWSLLHRALGFDFDFQAAEHSYLNQERTAWLSNAVYKKLQSKDFQQMMQSKGFFHEIKLPAGRAPVATPTAALPTSFNASQRNPVNSGYAVIEQAGAELVVTSNEHGVFVGVRGSSGVKDFVTDADAGFIGGGKPFPGWTGSTEAKAHPGFYGQNLAVRDQLARAIEYFNPDGKKKLVLTGHSKGGAEAIGLASMLHTGWEGRPPVGTANAVYTYGGARYFNKEGAQHYNDSPLGTHTFAIQNHLEVIPRVPPRFADYRHAGILFRYLPDSYEVFAFGEEPSDWLREAKHAGISLVTGHFLKKYVALGRGRTAVSTSALPGEYPRDTSIGLTSGHSL